MERRLYRELWNIRFQRMLKLEKNSAAVYEKLLAECRESNRDHSVVTHLERLVQDEKRHARLCEELLEILGRQID